MRAPRCLPLDVELSGSRRRAPVRIQSASASTATPSHSAASCCAGGWRETCVPVWMRCLAIGRRAAARWPWMSCRAKVVSGPWHQQLCANDGAGLQVCHVSSAALPLARASRSSSTPMAT